MVGPVPYACAQSYHACSDTDSWFALIGTQQRDKDFELTYRENERLKKPLLPR